MATLVLVAAGVTSYVLLANRESAAETQVNMVWHCAEWKHKTIPDAPNVSALNYVSRCMYAHVVDDAIRTKKGQPPQWGIAGADVPKVLRCSDDRPAAQTAQCLVDLGIVHG